jgi:DNA processing protein
MVAAQAGLSAPGSTCAPPDPGPAVQARPSPAGADPGGMPGPAGEANSAWPDRDGRDDGSAWPEAGEVDLAGLSPAGLSSAGFSSAGLGSAGLGSAGLGSAGLGSAGLAGDGRPAADGTGHAWPGRTDPGRGGSPYGVAGAGFLASTDEPDRLARAALGYLADPGDLVLGALLQHCSAVQVVAALMAGQHPLTGRPQDAAALPGLDRALARWSARLSRLPPPGQLTRDMSTDRLVCPGDPEWPTQLAALGNAAPIGLWLKGQADLRFACLRSVSVVGSRSATSYGTHVATELAATLAERGCGVVSGGAYGIDAAAHRGAMAGGGVTVAVLASGLRYGYPRGHTTLFKAIAERGVLVSELPPDHRPTRPGFLVRNRVIAALSRGTVVVEAAVRSGALATATRALDLCRPLMAVPGPVTSAQSAGCHEILRNAGAVLVTGAADVMDLAFPVGEATSSPARGPVLPRDGLDGVTRAVLEAVPSRGGTGPAALAVAAGVGLGTVLQCLGALAAAGFVHRSPQGWRAHRDL